MLARGLATVAALLVVAGLAGCANAAPDTADLDRLGLMRAEAIYAHLVSDPEMVPGMARDGGFTANTVVARVDPWAGANPPVGPTLAQRKAAVAGLVVALREAGWKIISARCGPTRAATGTGTDASAGTDAGTGTEASTLADDGAVGGYQWEIFGYRLRAEVPYTVHLSAGFGESSGFTARVEMATPFHQDTATYFAGAPDGLPAGTTCVEVNAVQDETTQGAIWSLDSARG